MMQSRWFRAGASCAFVLALGACGGGGGRDDPQPVELAQLSRVAEAPKEVPASKMLQTPSSASSALKAVRQAQAQAAPSASAFFDWAERTYPGFFPGPQADRVLMPYVYRYYPGTETYLAVNGELIYAVGPATGGQVVALGKLSDFACVISPASCAPGDVMINFKAAALPLFVGTYSGSECVKLAGGAAELGPATVKVRADGMVETVGVSDSVLKPSVAMRLSREFDGTRPTGAMYLISEPSDSHGLALMLTETLGVDLEATTIASVTNNSLGASCPASPEVATLKTNSIYATLATFIDSTARTIPCVRIDSSGLTAANVVYEVREGVARFGDDVLALTTGLKSETALVPAEGGLVFSSESMDGGTLVLTLDKYGSAVSVVATALKPGLSYSCELKPKS